MPDIWDSLEYRVFPKRHLCAAEVSAVSAVSSGTDMDTADTWRRLGELPAHRSPHTQPALTSSLPAARDTRVKAATDLLLSSLVTPSSPPASVAAAAERGRDVGDGGVQLLPEKTIWQ